MPIEINADDVAQAETFLENLLTQQVPEGRFTEGSALRDLVIKSLAFTFGHLQKENATIKSLQSLLTVRNIATTDPDLDRAAGFATDAILSNWFITRKSGKFARVVVFAEVTKRQDYVIPGDHKFIYDRDHVFYPDTADTTQSIIIRASDLLPVISFDGTVSGYQFSLNVVAARVGADYNVAPGNWKSGTGFSTFASRIFTVTAASGGGGRETTSEVILRANTAIAVRNLINPRSIDATLRERFTNINRMAVVGMGDPEMQRDLKIETSTAYSLHVGGHYDIYVELPRTQRTFNGQLGGLYTRPDNLINVFRDATVSDWTATAILPGDVIRVATGLAEAPRDFVIKEIYETELRVSTNTPFSVATDEVGTFISYLIYRPLYLADTQILPTSGLFTTGTSSRQVRNADTLILPGGAHYEILDVMVIDPDDNDPFINGSDGFVHFTYRVNTTPAPVVTSSTATYQITSTDPSVGQSQRCLDTLVLPSAYNNKNVRVRYETLVGLETIHAYTQNRFERILAANILVKGYHPVYLSFNVPYKLKPTATSSITESNLIQTLATYVNNFDPNDVIDVSDIATATRNYSSQIGAVYPFTISYELIAADGRIIRYSTENEVRIDSSKIITGSTDGALLNPNGLGISDRTVRYMTTAARITVENIT